MAITPYLYYEDLDAAMTWLRKALGLSRVGPAQKGPDGRASHATMQLGGGLVMMGQPASARKYKNPKRLGYTTQSLYIMVESVDRHHARAVKAGAVVLEAPFDTPYGHRRYGVADPEGHEWYFAQELRAPRKATASRGPAVNRKAQKASQTRTAKR
ncbi:MAG: VOC family protein [Vicinamibacterales bacterium]|nr:VOC family protein [Vicinamibacterales bacterium]